MSDLHAVRERIERSLGELRFGPGAAPVETEASVPEWIGKALWEAQRVTLVEGAGHRYVRRVPTGNPKRPWRYYYDVTGGNGGLGHHDEARPGAKFQIVHAGKEGHFEVIRRDGDHVVVRHDESGHEQTMTATALSSILRRHHAEKIDAHRARLKQRIEAAAKHGTGAQRSRLETEAKRHGHHDLVTGHDGGAGKQKSPTVTDNRFVKVGPTESADDIQQKIVALGERFRALVTEGEKLRLRWADHDVRDVRRRSTPTLRHRTRGAAISNLDLVHAHVTRLEDALEVHRRMLANAKKYEKRGRRRRSSPPPPNPS